MPFGYDKILNKYLGKALNPPIWIPDFRCMIGSAEMLAPVNILVPQVKNKIPNAVKDTNDLPYERLHTDIDGIALTEDDFIKNSRYLGRASGGY